MPLDVIMPALGMAQETGTIVSWHKKEGDAVAEGDVLFEVETDKATMEVAAERSGYLTAVTATDGAEVPVGDVIARIVDSAEKTVAASGDSSKREAPAAPEDGKSSSSELPEGRQIPMPTLGMSQDTGRLVAWLVAPGAKVGAEDALFEVETDKSTVEVPAGADGYLAACLAQPGEDVATGRIIAILTNEPPVETVSRSAVDTPEASDTPPLPEEKPAPVAPAGAPDDVPGARILASPKARRLAAERGLNLARLVEANVPQPYHVADLEKLQALSEDAAAAATPAPAAGSLRLTAEVDDGAFGDFLRWAAASAGLTDAPALLAGMAGASLGSGELIVAHEAFGDRRLFVVPPGPLGAVEETDGGTERLIVRDLRMTPITSLQMGAEQVPVLSLTRNGSATCLTLEADPAKLDRRAALHLLAEFSGRLEQPLRHLL